MKRCCPNQVEKGRTVSIRVEEQADAAAFRKKMEQPEQKAIYWQRGPVAEFPNAWIKEKLGLRKFRVRGAGEGGDGVDLGVPRLQCDAVVPADVAGRGGSVTEDGVRDPKERRVLTCIPY